MKKLTGKGKHTVTGRKLSMHKTSGRLKDKSSKIIYIHNKKLKDTQNN